MKTKSLLFTLAILTFAAFQSQAQIDATVNTLGVLAGGTQLGVDFAINDEFSVEGTIGYNNNDDVSIIVDDASTNYSYRGIPIQAVGKYYIGPSKGADKFYAAAFMRYVNRNYVQAGVEDPNTFTQSRFGIGFGLGTKIISRSGVVFDFGMNLGRVISENVAVNETDVRLPRAIVGFKIGIGYRFGA
ncbi:MAG: hypothetical protein AAFN81_01620 [Bacteroidota bacterium]